MKILITVWMLLGCAALQAAASGAEDIRDALRAMPDPDNGARLFVICAQCHEPHGGGLPLGWVPEIAGQHPSVLVRELVDYRHGARWDDRMEKIAGRHILKTPQEIADVVAYIGALRPTLEPRVGSGQWLTKGEHVYAAQCRSCHGGEGEGSAARAVPRLAGQQAEYLVRQMHDSAEGRRPNLRGIHARLFKPLSMEQLMGLADYLSRLGSAAAPGEQHAALP
ncbi:MAG TPA: c-type cytochrome [Steroidobacteraceae bacterium]|nr:c-type cytochrome [Steroidobacteraceae bacterium]